MAKKAAGAQFSGQVVNHLARMLVNHLHSTAYKGLTFEEMVRRIGVTAMVLKTPWWNDIPQICRGASVDVGIIIRDVKGHEVTLWPSDNFASGPAPRKVAAKVEKESDRLLSSITTLADRLSGKVSGR